MFAINPSLSGAAMNHAVVSVLIASLVCAIPCIASGQVARADYERAQGLRARYERLVLNIADAPAWIGGTNRFSYRRAVRDGFEFVVVDAATLQKQPAFDHARLAASLSKAAGTTYSATRLPFQSVTFTDGERAIEMTIAGGRWTCTLTDYTCQMPEPPPPPVAIRRGITGPVRGDVSNAKPRPRVSPDGKWEALVDNFNVAVRAAGDKKVTRLSTDGSEGNHYDVASIVWSPDSTKLAAYRIRPGYRRLVHYVASSPEDQVQPHHWAMQYAKPGDQLDLEQPVLFDVAARRQIAIDPALFPNPYDMSDLAWRKDSRAFTFEYNQRGHQVYRVIEVDGDTGAARPVISEEPKTFFYYNRSSASLQSGKRYRFDLADGREVIWMSERDGWNHLYLIDGATGAVKTQITKGNWPVRHVIKVDEDKGQLWFSAGGMTAGKDPYFQHYYRINFDGSGLTPLTTADANHVVEFSSDMTYFVDHYSRIDLAPVMELRRTADTSLVAEIERGDITELVKAGWKAPEMFVAKGRDGVTDIWGIVFKPANFDPTRKYPVIENIYAGPHGSHVPKSFSAFGASQAQAELGFVVVQIDGMGTSNRSKAFQDVAWRNLKDAGFPDRILWHRAYASQNAWYDISRVGIYGGSAGGQSSLGALLFHPDFYKVAVSYAGCHDNRMDKIWWNEQWMGWPIEQQYSDSSNVDHAWRLQGKVLLVVGELDTNVDPSSTMQVVNALIKANKNFDLLVIPGAEHNAGRGGESGEYGERKRFDFFVRHLLGQNPPEWSAPPTTTSTAPASGPRQ
jgi:dipeptidyl aminopeptidase/acylaminoacyl peptidase